LTRAVNALSADTHRSFGASGPKTRSGAVAMETKNNPIKAALAPTLPRKKVARSAEINDAIPLRERTLRPCLAVSYPIRGDKP